jgi:hypothetical protein
MNSGDDQGHQDYDENHKRPCQPAEEAGNEQRG